MAAESTSPGAEYDRTVARIYRRRNTGTDRLSADPPRVGQVARLRASRRYRPGNCEVRGPAMKSGIFLLLIALLAGFAGGCKSKGRASIAVDPLHQAYDSELDWSDSQRVIPLSYDEAQGKRIFYVQCVWCHSDATPAGPSNRSNL